MRFSSRRFLYRRSRLLIEGFPANRGSAYNDVPATYPAFLTRSEAEEVTRLLGGSLPSEEQWEYACRAGTSSLFCFGSKVLSKDQLERWLEWDLSDPNLASNGFGLTGLFFGEWCRDLFTRSYASDAEKLPDAYAIRGGGVYFWARQDEEWVGACRRWVCPHLTS